MPDTEADTIVEAIKAGFRDVAVRIAGGDMVDGHENLAVLVELEVALLRGLAHLPQAPANQEELADPNTDPSPRDDDFVFHPVLLSFGNSLT